MTYGKPTATPYRMARCERAVRALSASRIVTLDYYLVLFRQMASEHLSRAGDTYPGMPFRQFLKVMDAEDFEPLFSDGIDDCSTHVFGRPSDGIVVVVTQAAGFVTEGAAEAVNLGLTDFAFDVFTEGFASQGGGNTKSIRFTFNPTRGLRLKLGAMRLDGGRGLPFWWSVGDRAHGERKTPGLMTREDVLRFREGRAGFRADPDLSVHDQILAENARRNSLLPEEWRHRLDVRGTRTHAEALSLSGITP